MIRHLQLEHRFVPHLPERLAPGVLYISMEFGTAAHSCCCGCGEEVVTPFTPTDWRMTFDGETISLHPSVGNWNLPCRSHYVIRRGRVVEAESWSDRQIAGERRRDKAEKARFYGHPTPTPTMTVESDPDPISGSKNGAGWWSRVTRWLSELGR